MHRLTLTIIDFTRLSTQKQLIESNVIHASEETKKSVDQGYALALVYLDEQVVDVHSTILIK